MVTSPGSDSGVPNNRLPHSEQKLRTAGWPLPPFVRDCFTGPEKVNDAMGTPNTGPPPLPDARWQSRQWQIAENRIGPADWYWTALHKHWPVSIQLSPNGAY